MSPANREQRLYRRAEEVIARIGRAQAETRRIRDQPPRPGDLFVHRATADFSVQWAVLDRHPRDERRLLLVAADLNPLIGSTDVAAPAESASGALSLRCGFEVRLDARDLDPEMRTGFLEPDVCERARRKRAEIELGHLISSAAQRETDTEHAYQDWAEGVLAKAQAALAASRGRWPSDEEVFYLNGIHGETGEYLVPPVDCSRAAALARSEIIDPGVLRLLENVHHLASQAHLGLPAGVEAKDPARAGWGVVFHAAESPAVKDALAPLVEHRRAQLGAAKTKILEYRPGEDWRQWLARQGVGAGDVQPAKVPYYLLLIGEPVRISYDFERLLGLEYAVGRLSFERASDYRQYAESTIDLETGAGVPQAKTAVFFAPRHPFDPVTRGTADQLVRPLIEGLPEAAQPGVAERCGFAPVGLCGEDATRANLGELLEARRGSGPPGLIFAAAHGLGWPRGHSRQVAAQGALLCQDWPGPGRIDPSHCFGAGELRPEARVHGTIAFLFASYGAGTPEREGFLREPGKPPPRIARQPFVAGLPKRLLAHPRGGALAVIGLVERAWGYAFAAPAGDRLRPFQSALGGLLAGEPVGHAVREFNQRYAALASSLSAMRKKMGFGARLADREVAAAWIERNHSQSYVVLGDPAVRLRVEVME